MAYSVSTAVKNTRTISPRPFPSIDIMRYTGILKLVVCRWHQPEELPDTMRKLISWDYPGTGKPVKVHSASVNTSTVEPSDSMKGTEVSDNY